jgi:hypothetical protein
VVTHHSTLAAERQDPDFLIGPRNENNEKKGRPLKFFINRPNLQAGISNEKHHIDSCACHRPPASPHLLS